MNQVHIPPPITVTISSKGQLAIPREIRMATALETGSKVVLITHEDGSIEIRPIKNSISELFAVAKPFVKQSNLEKNSSDEKAIMKQILIEDDATKSKK